MKGKTLINYGYLNFILIFSILLFHKTSSTVQDSETVDSKVQETAIDS